MPGGHAVPEHLIPKGAIYEPTPDMVSPIRSSAATNVPIDGCLEIYPEDPRPEFLPVAQRVY